MDNHNSYMTAEFINLGLQYNIVLFTFPGHLIYCIQPCDIGIFQSYKYWYNKAVQSVLENLDFEYNLLSFFRDLKHIHSNTFKNSILKYIFEKSGVWPIDQ